MNKVVVVLSRLKYAAALSLAVLALAATASAQDPPGRAGRLNFFTGSVSFRPAGLDDWGPAELNLTLTTGDRLWTESGSRAELHVGRTSLRMASQTDLDILNIDDDTTQLSIAQGSLCVHIHHLYSNELFEVDTPNSAITLLRPGSYRIDVDPNGHQSRVIVHSGDADVTAEGSAFPVRPNQLALVYGDESLDYDIRSIGPADEWDQWCLSREQREDAIAEQHYVSEEMTGYEDLAGYGTWRTDPDAGTVWVPTNVGADWAPYATGHWYWRGYWGWTWVDDSPWGYAPFHYGRWAFIGGYWGWCPGVYIERPFFAPALVAFVGFGAGISWFPLGPHEAFVPGYHCSAAYYHSINVTHVNVTNINEARFDRNYVNRNARGAVHGMSQKDFANGRRVAGGAQAGKFGTGPVTGTHAAIAPNKQGLFGGKGGKAGQPPSSSLHRGIVAKTAPPSVTPFSKQQSELKAHPGEPLGRQQVAATGGGFASKSFRSASVSTGGAGLHASRSGIAAAHSLSGSKSTSGGGRTVSGGGGVGKTGGTTSGGGKGTGSAATAGGKGAPLDSGGKGSSSISGKGTGPTGHARDSLDRGTKGGTTTGRGGPLEGGKSLGSGTKTGSTGSSLTGPKSIGTGSSRGTGTGRTRSTSKGSTLGAGGGGGSTGGGAHRTFTHKSTSGLGGGSGSGHSATGTGRSTTAGTRRSTTSGSRSTGGGGRSASGGQQRSTVGSGQRSTGTGGQRSGGGGQRSGGGGGGVPHLGGAGGGGGGGGKKKH